MASAVACPHTPAHGAFTHPRSTGFTLVEMAVVCAVVAVLASLAWPSWQQHLQRARRADAVAALTRLQAAQESLRSHAGLYSADLAALQTNPTSPEGFYALSVELDGPDAYRATASARAGQRQAGDTACAALVLSVRSGFAEHGPSPKCWNL